MGIVNANSSTVVLVEDGKALTIVADAFASGMIYQLKENNNIAADSARQIVAGLTLILGPYNGTKRIKLVVDSGSIATQVTAADSLNVNGLGVFDVTKYGAVGGSKDDSAAVNAALAAIYANKGGKLLFPFMMAGYTLGSSITVDVGQYSMGSGIVIDFGGNTIVTTHTGWAFDIKTNYFGANNGALLGNKPVIINGQGANLINQGGVGAIGGIRMNDTVVWALRDVVINEYSGGTAVQLNITSNDLSTWVEHGDMADVRGSGNLNGLWCKSSNPVGSFLGNYFSRIAFEGRVNNCKLYWLQGLMFNCQFNMCGGYYNQTIGGTKRTGGNGFYLDGGYTGTTFVSPWIDGGGGGDQDPLHDFFYGPNYTNTQSYFPVLENTSEINLPPTWRDTMLLPGVIGFGTLIGEMAANPREVLRNNRTYYVATNGNDSNNGLTVGKPFATVAKVLTVLRDTIDMAGKTVTIQLADGTYTEAVVCRGNPVGLGSSSVILQGNFTTPGNVVISTTNANALTLSGGANLTIKGIKLQTTTGGTGLFVSERSRIVIDSGCQFGACAARHIYVSGQSYLVTLAGYAIKGNSPKHLDVAISSVIELATGTIDATNIAFSNNFLVAGQNSSLVITCAFTTTGSTGSRYYLTDGALVQTFGAGAAYLPGNANGFAEAGQFAQYL